MNNEVQIQMIIYYDIVYNKSRQNSKCSSDITFDALKVKILFI